LKTLSAAKLRGLSPSAYPGKPGFFAGKAWFLKIEAIRGENKGDWADRFSQKERKNILGQG
jgi:hypothetical protein